MLKREDLILGKWYIFNPNPPSESSQGIGLTAGVDYKDYPVAGPFESKSGAESYLENHPEFGGPYAHILLHVK